MSQPELHDVLAEWFRRVDAGEDPDLEEFCSESPDLLPVLARILDEDASVQAAIGALARDERVDVPVPRIGKYQLLRPIGEGSMGRVFLAEDTALRRTVAIKLVHPHLIGDPRKRLRFEREARVTAALDHPNIVPIYDVGIEPDFAYMAMKFLSGSSLDRVGTLPPRDVARIGAAIARALFEAHQLGVIHRDVKPANILLEENGNPILVDFGLARSASEVNATIEGTIAGTLLYMSPEQLRGETVTLDGRTDVYSLGATLYETVAGRPAFDATSTESVIAKVMTTEPAALTLSPSDRDLDTILRRAMDKDRQRRFPTALEMAKDLERFARGELIVSRRASVLRKVHSLARRHPKTSLAVSVLLLALAAVTLRFAALSLKTARQFERSVRQAEMDIAENRLLAAESRVRELRDRRPDDPRLVHLDRALSEAQTLELVLDQLQERGVYELTAALRGVLADLQRSGVRDHALAQLATTVAQLRLGDRASARETLSLLPADRSPRAHAALTAVIDGADPIVALHDVAAGDDADDHLFAALALDIAGPSYYRAMLEELAAALSADPTHVRARLAWAKMLYHRGDMEAAREAFRGVIQEGRHRAVVLRNLAVTSLRLSDLRAAREHLERVPAEDRNWQFTLASAELLRQEGRPRDALQLLTSAEAGQETRTPLQLLAADIQLQLGDAAAARSTLEQVHDSSLTAIHAYHRDLLAARMDLTASDRALTDDDVRRARQLVVNAPAPHLASEAMRLLSSALLSTERVTESIEVQLDGVRLSPHNAPAIAELAARVLLPLPGVSREQRIRLVSETATITDGLLDSSPDATAMLPRATLHQLYLSRALMAYSLGDRPTFRRYAALYEERAEDSERKARNLDALRRYAESLPTGDGDIE